MYFTFVTTKSNKSKGSELMKNRFLIAYDFYSRTYFKKLLILQTKLTLQTIQDHMTPDAIYRIK